MQLFNKKSEQFIGNVLRMGVIASIGTILLGAILFFIQDGSLSVDYRTFVGQPADLTHFSEIFAQALLGKGLYLIQMGILFIIATPILRILTCLITFFLRSDRMYALLSALVLLILLYSFF